MRKLFAVVVVTGGIALSPRCQKLNESQVPSAVRTAFDKKYPHTKAGWDKEEANYEANFKQDGKRMSVVIDRSGTIVETETNIPVADLPKVIQEYMNKNYGGIKIEEAARIVKANGDINYEIDLQGNDIVFDTNGKFIKKLND